MRPAPVCPRCGGPLRAPGAWSSAWNCSAHGAVDPLQAPHAVSLEYVRSFAGGGEIPVWVPWPLPESWLVTGVRYAGDERTGPRAVAVACSGPAPLGGIGELVLVAESPGAGLGAGLAGTDGVDPGERVTAGPPDAKVLAQNRPTPLWAVPSADDRAVFVGEARGCWLWAVLWPQAAGYLVAERLMLADLLDMGLEPDLPTGALSPRLEHSAVR